MSIIFTVHEQTPTNSDVLSVVSGGSRIDLVMIKYLNQNATLWYMNKFPPEFFRYSNPGDKMQCLVSGVNVRHCARPTIHSAAVF